MRWRIVLLFVVIIFLSGISGLTVFAQGRDGGAFPAQLPETGGRSELGQDRDRPASPDDLNEPYTGMSGQAERSLQNCQRKLRNYNFPMNPNGRIANFWLEATPEQTAQYSFVGPGAACVPVIDKRQLSVTYGYFLAIYDGGLSVQFPDFGGKSIIGRIGADTRQELGDVGTWNSIMLRKVVVQHFNITDPAPTTIIQDNRRR